MYNKRFLKLQLSYLVSKITSASCDSLYLRPCKPDNLPNLVCRRFLKKKIFTYLQKAAWNAQCPISIKKKFIKTNLIINFKVTAVVDVLLNVHANTQKYLLSIRYST